MTKSKKGILIAIIAAAVLLAALGGAAAWYTGAQNSYSRHIALGEKYLSEGDYTNAAMVYQKAIEQKPEEAEGYMGLVRVYTTQGQTVMAQSVLRTGIDRTGSARLRLMLEELLNAGGAAGETEAAALVPTKKNTGTGTLDTGLLVTLRKTQFNEYRLRYGVQSSTLAEDGGCVVRVENVAAELLYTAGTVDRVAGRPQAESLPAQAHLDSVSLLLGGRQSATLEELRHMGAETPTLARDEAHGYVVQFTAGGCTVTVASDEEGTVRGDAWNVVDFPSAEEELQAGSCQVSGKVINAVTGSGVSEAELTIYEGSQTVGTPLKTMKTDAFGSYALGLDSGNYTVRVECGGYTGENFSLYVGSAPSATNDFVISPTLEEGQIRIVLEWGSFPTDLDSYLNGTLDDGTVVRTSFRQKSCTANGSLVAELDVDDINGNGPETTTIYNTNGKFTFTVVDFNGTGEMSNSGATVKVYLPGEANPTVINICGGLENGWSVCEIDHGEVRVINASAPTSPANPK